MKIYFIAAAALMMSVGCSGGSKDEKDNSPYRHAQTQGYEQQPNEGTGVANGGGVIVRDGNLLTVAEAGITFNLGLEEVDDGAGDQSHLLSAELGLVEKVIRHFSIDDFTKMTMLANVLPVGGRKYFVVKESDLSPEKKKKLLAAYFSLLGEDVPANDEIALVAVTIGRETYILPDYFKLRDTIARAAIVYHESLWVKNPKLKLSIVLNAEAAFEKYLRSSASQEQLGYDENVFRSIELAFSDAYITIFGALNKDLENGPIDIKYPRPDGSYTLVKKKNTQFKASELVGVETFYKCYNNLVNKNLLEFYYRDLISLNPNSRFFKAISRHLKYLEFYRSEGSSYGFQYIQNDEIFDFNGEVYSRTSRFDRDLSIASAFCAKYGCQWTESSGYTKFYIIRGLRTESSFFTIEPARLNEMKEL